MGKSFSFSVLSLLAFVLFSVNISYAQEGSAQSHAAVSADGQHNEESNGKYNPTNDIMHHIADSHEYHIYGEGENAAIIPLPVILWTKHGLKTFMSSKFEGEEEGDKTAEVDGMTLILHHNKIYYANAAGNLEENADGEIANDKPFDISITKNVFTLLLSGLLLCIVFMTVGASYKKNKGVPKGLTSFMEPLVIFVRDDIARPQIGTKYMRYMPYLLTVFFLIWINNLIGLIPFFPFSANLSGNIAFTFTMAVIALFVVNLSGRKNYWTHVLAPKPWWLWPILMPIELLSNVVTKFFALMIRLFANITAGHIIVLSLVSLIFIFKNVWMAGVAVPFALFISVLELLVAALQAYIFTMLTALFIGQAVAEGDHHA